jgi:hypothetical protein
MTTRFNPPPDWPPAPADRVAPKAQDSRLAMAGGIAVVLGSLLPLVSFNGVGEEVKPAARYASLVVGLALVALGFALRAAPQPGRLIAGIATLGLSSLAGLTYVGLIVAGITGVLHQDQFGNTASLTFSPNIGIVLAAAGCAAAYTAAIMSFHHR